MSQNEIVSETNYYPFGLAHKGYNEHVNSTNLGEHYKYNGKEEENELGLGWTDYGARRYMKDLGRWAGVDALAEKYEPLSPFSYTANNPILYVDPDGKRIKIANNTKDALTKLAQIAATQGGRTRLNALIGDSRTYTLNKVFLSSNAQFNPFNKQVDYPSTVWRFGVDGGNPGATFVLGHEIDHAYRHQQGQRLNRNQFETTAVHFGNYLRDVYGKSRLRKMYQGIGRINTIGTNRKGEKVNNFKQLDDLSAESNTILGFSYDAGVGDDSKTEYIISATTSNGTYHYVRFDNKKDYQERLDYIKEEQKKKDEEDK